MKTAIVCAVWGDYHKYADRWLSAVRQMDPAPDKIVLGTDIEDSDFFLPEEYRTPARASNYLVKNFVDEDWTIFADIDDVLFPDALGDLDESADIHGFNLITDTGVFVFSNVDRWKNIMDIGGITPFPGASAVKTDTVLAVERPDIKIHDVGFWINCKKAGKKAAFDNRIRFLYRTGGLSAKGWGNSDHAFVERMRIPESPPKIASYVGGIELDQWRLLNPDYVFRPVDLFSNVSVGTAVSLALFSRGGQIIKGDPIKLSDSNNIMPMDPEISLNLFGRDVGSTEG